MSKESQTSHDPDERRLMYQVTVSELAHFKNQQWSVTNHALLLDAGIVGIVQMLKPGLSNVDRALLVIAAVVIAVAALLILGKLQASILVRQSRLSAVRAEMGEAFKRAWSAKEKDGERVHAIYLLRGAVVIGALAAGWLAGWRL